MGLGKLFGSVEELGKKVGRMGKLGELARTKVKEERMRPVQLLKMAEKYEPNKSEKMKMKSVRKMLHED